MLYAAEAFAIVVAASVVAIVVAAVYFYCLTASIKM